MNNKVAWSLLSAIILLGVIALFLGSATNHEAEKVIIDANIVKEVVDDYSIYVNLYESDLSVSEGIVLSRSKNPENPTIEFYLPIKYKDNLLRGDISVVIENATRDNELFIKTNISKGDFYMAIKKIVLK